MSWKQTKYIKGESILATWSGTWTGNSSTTTDVLGNMARVVQVGVHFDGTETNDTKISLVSENGSNYNFVIVTIENGAGATDNSYLCRDTPIYLRTGDRLSVACNLAVASNAYCTITAIIGDE